VAEHETVVVTTRLEGVNSGPFLGVPASGERVCVPDVTIFTFRGGRIRTFGYMTDLLRVMTTIGAVQRVA
jgi:predicted ester cyclase